ncbi:hypothetical protein ACIQI7_32295 [Kitasatospora sp. NPDC092039]|uniref:hypothetical protein n=1 Tax=Kitasatospora sp. NPDC092039 TaxID=3364086 RepID=UPI0037F4F86F
MAHVPPPYIDLHPLMSAENPLPPGNEDLAARITVQLAQARLAAAAFTTADYTDTALTRDELWSRFTAMRGEACALAALLNEALLLIPYEQVPGVWCVSTASVVEYLTVPRYPVIQRELHS